MIQVKHIKKVTSFLLLIVTALMLVACSNKDNVPYGSLTDNEYLSFEGVTITEKELYSNLRRDSQNIVNMLIEEELFKGYKDEANSLLDEVNPAEDSDAEVVQTKFDNIINTRMFNSTDVEALKSMPSINLHTNVLTFVNSLYRINSSIDRDSLKDDILSLLSGEDFGSGYYTISELKDFYLIDIQKHLYAKEKLALDLEDEESSQYVTTTNIINYYNNSVANRDDVKVFYFDFLNLNEANAALRTLGLKATSTGHYYNVPNIRLVADYEAIKQSDSETLETALEKAGLNWFDNEPWAAGATETGITESQYTNFYNAYPVSDASGNKLEAIEVLEKFVEIYNLLNEYDNNGILVNGISIVDNTVDLKDIEIIYDNDASPFELDKTYEDLSEFNSSFANYIYNDLNEDRPYSTIRAVGNKRYLAFKLSEDAVELDYVSAEKDEDDKSKFVTIDELKALLADSETKEETLKQLNSLITITGETVSEAQWAEIETIINDNIESWRLEVEKTRLTDNYVTTAIRELTQSLDIEIFDQVVRAYYNTTGEANGKNRSGDNLLTVKYEIFEEEKTYTLTVDAFYARLEANNGLEMALDLLLNEYLLNEYGEKDHGIFKDFADEIDEAKFKADYETLITNFSNDAFAQSGYPASLGRETFLLVVFGATNANEAIELGYLLPKLRELFFENSELSLPELSQDDLFANLQAYTQKQYEEFKGVSVHHMLIHFEDESGNLLDPNEYFESLDQAQIDTIKQAVVDLHAIVLDIIGTRSTGSANSDAKVPLADYQNIFNNYLINSYNETVRIDLGNFADTRFQEFKKLGLNITFENISSNITNSSNFPYAGSTLDPVFYDRAMALHELITKAVEADEDILNGGIPHFDFGGSFNVLDDLNNDLINQLDADGIMSNFGFHFILVDKIIERSSAKYEPSQSEQDNPRYQFEIDGVKYNPYNETSEYLTLEQIKYYVLGADLDALVPSSVQTAINTYFNPVNTLFNNDSMKQAIFYNFISGASFNGEQQAKFDQIVEINETTFYNYMNTIPEMDDAADYDVIYNNWNALYGGWFEAFGLK